MAVPPGLWRERFLVLSGFTFAVPRDTLESEVAEIAAASFFLRARNLRSWESEEPCSCEKASFRILIICESASRGEHSRAPPCQSVIEATLPFFRALPRGAAVGVAGGRAAGGSPGDVACTNTPRSALPGETLISRASSHVNSYRIWMNR